MTDRPTLGTVIDKLGVDLRILDDPDRVVTDVILIAKHVSMEDGDIGLATVWTSGTNWIDRAGMLTIAKHVEIDGYTNG